MFKWLFGKQRSLPFDDSNDQIVEPTGSAFSMFDMPFKGEIATDTASLIVFDLAALAHRLDDECDWWADPNEELAELKKRNVLIVGLGSDGYYDVEVGNYAIEGAPTFSLQAPSGTIFVGPGEEITGGGNEPDGQWGGYFVSVEPGDYAVSAGRTQGTVRVGIVKADAFDNDAAEPVLI
jgi:hypothetical protein